MAKELQAVDTDGTGTALRDAVVAWCEKGYLLIGDGLQNQYYKPFGDSEPWDCACVAIWQDKFGNVWAEEY